MAEKTDQTKPAPKEAPRPPDDAITLSDGPAETSPDDQTAQPAASAKTAEQTTAEPASTETKAPASETDNNPKMSGRTARRRIGKMTRQISTMEQSQTADREELKRLRTELATTRQAQVKATPEPEFTSYSDPKEYARDFAKWETDQTAEPAKPPATAAETAAATAAASSSSDSATDHKPVPGMKEFHELGQKNHGDKFLEALKVPDIAVDEVMAGFMMDSDQGPDIYIHLTSDPVEARRINDLPESEKTTALEALETKAADGKLIAADGTVTKPAETKPAETKPAVPGDVVATKAGDPPDDSRDSGKVVTNQSLEKMDMDDYAATRTRESEEARGHYR